MVRVVGKEGALGTGRGVGIEAAAWMAIYIICSNFFFFSPTI